MPAIPAVPICGAPGTTREQCSGAGGAFHAHRSYLEAGAHPGAVPYIRRHTRQILAAWRLGHVADDIELVVSELVTNAVTATLGMQAAASVALYLALERGRLFVLVWDCCPDLPTRRDHASDAEPGHGLELSGRGLHLVQALSADWGASAQPGGKVTWARFDLEAAR
jgi:anti-sigma regulatory factor (Ser/Thr protein kinase)